MPDVNDTVAQDTTTAPSSPAETTNPVEDLDSFDLDESDFDETAEEDTAADTSDEDSETADATEDADDAEETESDDGKDETKESEPALDRAETRKKELNDEIRELVAKRNQLRDEEQQNSTEPQTYYARTPEELASETNPDTGELYTPMEARLQAMVEQNALRDHNQRVQEAVRQIDADAKRITEDFPIFNENNADYNKDLATATAEFLHNNLYRDPVTKEVTGEKLSSYAMYKLVADARNQGITEGELKGQKAAKKSMAKAETPSSSGPKENKKDAFQDAFDAEFDKF